MQPDVIMSRAMHYGIAILFYYNQLTNHRTSHINRYQIKIVLWSSRARWFGRRYCVRLQDRTRSAIEKYFKTMHEEIKQGRRIKWKHFQRIEG